MEAGHQLAWYANLIGQGLLLVASLRRSRPRLAPVFLLWVGVSLLRSLALLGFGSVGRNSYFLIYVVTEPVLLLLLGAAVREAYLQQSRGYLAMGRVGSWLLHAGLGLSALAAVVVLASDKGAWPQAAMRALLVARMAAFGFLAAFTFCGSLVFAIWRAPSVSPTHFRLLAAYLLLHTFGMTAMYWLGQSTVALVNVGQLAAGAALWVAWLFVFLTPAQAAAGPSSEPQADAEAEQVEDEARALLDHARRAARS